MQRGGDGPVVEVGGRRDGVGVGGAEGERGDDREALGLGQQPDQVTGRGAQGRPIPSSALRSLVGVSLGEILGQASTIRPSAPTRKAERMIPM